MIVPLVGDPSSERALEIARRLAANGEMCVELVNVLDTRLFMHETFATRQQAAVAYLQAVRSTFPAGILVNAHVLAGDPAVEIATLSSQLENPLIILAPRWSGSTASFLEDGVTAKLLQQVRAPVMLVPANYEEKDSVIENVVVPVSGNSPDAEAILSLCRMFGGRELAFRVITIDPGAELGWSTNAELDGDNPDPHGPFTEISAGWNLMMLSEQLREQGVRSNWEVRYGEPVYEIVRAAQTTGASIVAVADPRENACDTSNAASTALRVSYELSEPVIVFPANSRRAASPPLLTDMALP